MGLADELNYRHHKPNPFQRGVQDFGSSQFGAWVFSKSLRDMDRGIMKLTHGPTTAPKLLAGIPVVMVTTTGRKSGQPCATPLISIPIGETLALLGTNFGQKNTPAWVFNLEADPHLRLVHDRITREPSRGRRARQSAPR